MTLIHANLPKPRTFLSADEQAMMPTVRGRG